MSTESLLLMLSVVSGLGVILWAQQALMPKPKKVPIPIKGQNTQR